MDILVIPDAHAKPGVDNKRFELAGRLIVDRKPDVIVCLGDLFDFPSMSHYDRKKLQFEGRRYSKDIEAGIDAQERLFKPLDDFNRSRTKSKYSPRRCITLGNHEHRVVRAVQENSELEGTLTFDDMQLEEFGWEVTPFKELLQVEGMNFTHYFPNGLMDKPISGAAIGRSIIQRWHQSGWQGHNHILNVANEVDADGKRMWAGSLGWFGNHKEDYVSETIQKSWWAGCTILHGVSAGDCDPEFIKLSTMEKMYG